MPQILLQVGEDKKNKILIKGIKKFKNEILRGMENTNFLGYMLILG